MSADPVTIHRQGSDLNPYAYVAGRVMSHVDPFGLEDKPPQPGCIGKEKCDEIPEWQKELQKKPEVGVDGGTSVPVVEEPKPVPPVKDAFEPTKEMNWLDRWIVGGSDGFHDFVTSDRNLAVVQTGFAAIAITAATIATGGLALEAAGLTLEGLGATRGSQPRAGGYGIHGNESGRAGDRRRRRRRWGYRPGGRRSPVQHEVWRARRPREVRGTESKRPGIRICKRQGTPDHSENAGRLRLPHLRDQGW